jgi:hypothetical protein
VPQRKARKRHIFSDVVNAEDRSSQGNPKAMSATASDATSDTPKYFIVADIREILLRYSLNCCYIPITLIDTEKGEVETQAFDNACFQSENGPIRVTRIAAIKMAIPINAWTPPESSLERAQCGPEQGSISVSVAIMSAVADARLAVAPVQSGSRQRPQLTKSKAAEINIVAPLTRKTTPQATKADRSAFHSRRMK